MRVIVVAIFFTLILFQNCSPVRFSTQNFNSGNSISSIPTSTTTVTTPTTSTTLPPTTTTTTTMNPPTTTTTTLPPTTTTTHPPTTTTTLPPTTTTTMSPPPTTTTTLPPTTTTTVASNPVGLGDTCQSSSSGGLYAHFVTSPGVGATVTDKSTNAVVCTIAAPANHDILFNKGILVTSQACPSLHQGGAYRIRLAASTGPQSVVDLFYSSSYSVDAGADVTLSFWAGQLIGEVNMPMQDGVQIYNDCNGISLTNNGSIGVPTNLPLKSLRIKVGAKDF